MKESDPSKLDFDEIEQLAIRFKEHDQDAATVLDGLLRPRLLAFISKILQAFGMYTPDRAEDILQDSWVRILDCRSKILYPRAFVRFFFAIARNTTMTWLRRPNNRDKNNEPISAGLDFPRNDDLPFPAKLEIKQITERVKKMRDGDILLDTKAHKIAETAQKFGITEEQVKYRARKALEKAKRNLNNKGRSKE